jgi:hypothetical protein
VPRPRPLSDGEARRTLAHRLGGRVDRLRQFATRLGIRPYRCWLHWTKWTGAERGQGREVEIPGGLMEILPTPKIKNLDQGSYQFFSGGVLPVGSVRVQQISVNYTADQLTGLAVPTADFTEDNNPPRRRSARELPAKPSNIDLPHPFDFCWEIAEDERGDDPAARHKFRLLSWPWRDAGGVQWSVLLERVSNDENRDGTLDSGFDQDR